MKVIGKILALAMVGEGLALCVAQRQYLEMWTNAFSGLKHWLGWFEDNPSKTRAIGTIEICCGIFLLSKTK